MTKYGEIIYAIASGNFGLITSSEAREAGITNNELVQYAKRGRVERVGQGVYRLVQRVSEPHDSYALAVKLVGAGAYLYGETVLRMLDLCPADSEYLHVATPNRVRRALPDYIRIVYAPGVFSEVLYDGIPCQSVPDAIRAAIGHVQLDTLVSGASRAFERGYITRSERNALLKELRSNPR